MIKKNKGIYTKIPHLRRFVLQNFPFIEEDFDALTDYELLCKVVEYLNKVITSQNALIGKVEELEALFNQLHNYVEHYFDNLDVQEEINNKLDKMAEDGTLDDIISNQLDGIRTELQNQFDIFENQTNTAINNISEKVDSTVSGMPIPVASTSDMTDHTKIYLNTSDGYWYYWSNNQWTRGNVYQATSILNGSITPQKTTFAKRSENLIDVKTVSILNAYIDPDSHTILGNSGRRTLYISCDPNTTYIITRTITGGRFTVATSIDTPALNSGVAQIIQRPNQSYTTITTSATAQYLVIYYWVSGESVTTDEEALNDLCVLKGTTNRGVIPSYIIEVKNDNLNNSAVTPDKTNFGKQSSNIFNKNDYNINTIFPNNTTHQVDTSRAVRSVYLQCNPNSNYVVHRLAGKRFSVFTTSGIPNVGSNIIDIVNNNNASEIKISTSQEAHYLCVYLYNANQDSLTLQQFIDSLVITEGTASIEEYIPYGQIIEVFTDNINDGAVTPEKLSTSVKDSILSLGKYASRNGIYGVQYDITSLSSACTRIANAEGLKNDYIVDSTYQLHGGINDFDNVFPYCDIKRCNITISDNGNKSVTYEGESGFALDGSNGDVMVEIPKFYSFRKREGNIETVAISGEPKSGFNVEPAFMVDGKEVDYIYVACYQTSPSNGTAYSYSGAFPYTYCTLGESIQALENNNLQVSDFTVYLMLQKLMMIEFADRGITQYLGGLLRLPYLGPNSINVIDGFGTNYITFQEGVGQGILDALWVGERIKIGDDAHENSLTNVRVITDITKTGTQYKVTYDGVDLSDSISIGSGVGCFGQRSGLCDPLTYHTGRLSKAPESDISQYVSPIRYRYMENIVGNIWDMLAGLKIKNLNVFWSDIPNFNESTTDQRWKKISYNVPLNSSYPSANNGWILKEGYDFNNTLINLPSQVGTGGGVNKYYGGTFFSGNTQDVEYTGVFGGGWDTYIWANPNTLRINLPIQNYRSQLYGSRAIYRG